MNGIVLDTNVISEPRRPAPDPRVRAWFEAQEIERLYLTATVIAELAAGIERMPKGRKRVDFERWLEALVVEDFAGRVLAFDVEAALLYGKLVADALVQGRPPTVGDAQIAAVARLERMAVATRDVADFELMGVPVIDPWQNG
ncbi:MAG: type II toxin-antitoxin system VapC family toxin [Geminicoccaceae bacterium]